MRKLLSITALIIIASQPVAAIFELGTDGNYFSQTTTLKDNSVSPSRTYTFNFSGSLFDIYGHLTFGVPNVVTFGIGPQVAFSSQSASNHPTNWQKDELSYFRFGLDTKLQMEMIPGISPFVRFSLGKDSIGFTESSTVNGSTGELKYTFGGMYYNALVGLQIPLAPVFAFYLQAGITGSPNSNMTIESFTVNGTNVAVAQTGTVDASYTGFIIGGGARLSF